MFIMPRADVGLKPDFLVVSLFWMFEYPLESLPLSFRQYIESNISVGKLDEACASCRYVFGFAITTNFTSGALSAVGAVLVQMLAT
jgi:hypothetical protein